MWFVQECTTKFWNQSVICHYKFYKTCFCYLEYEIPFLKFELLNHIADDKTKMVFVELPDGFPFDKRYVFVLKH